MCQRTTGSLWRSSSSLTRLRSMFWHFHISFRALKEKGYSTKREEKNVASTRTLQRSLQCPRKDWIILCCAHRQLSIRLETQQVFVIVILPWSPLVCHLGHISNWCIVIQILCGQVHAVTKNRQAHGHPQTPVLTIRWWNVHHSGLMWTRETYPGLIYAITDL